VSVRTATFLWVISAMALLIAACADDNGSSSAGPGSVAPADPEIDEPVRVECEISDPIQTRSYVLEFDGGDRLYRVAVPDGVPADEPVPLILNFHGHASDMDEQALYSGLPAEGALRGYAVVTPNGSGDPRNWTLGGGTDDDLVAALIDLLSDRVCIDPDRVYAAGISAGSAFAAFSACREPYRYAAIGLVAATVPVNCPADVTPAVISFHGTADETVRYEGGGDPEGTSGANTLAPPVEPTLLQWAEHNGCDPAFADESIGEDVTRRVWTACHDGADIVFYKVDGGGHTWPGAIDLREIGITSLGATTQTISATELMLDFFDRHSATST
jgi:polyhydroxybutyrate depolymerase